MNDCKSTSPSEVVIPPRDLAIRVAWIALRLVAVYLLAEHATPFFYQAF